MFLVGETAIAKEDIGSSSVCLVNYLSIYYAPEHWVWNSEIRKGLQLVGTHVRDAACYVLWTFAACFDRASFILHSERLDEHLLMAALFDREGMSSRSQFPGDLLFGLHRDNQSPSEELPVLLIRS